MARETIALSHSELDRLGLIQAVAGGELTQRAAARRLDLSTRQIKRLVRRYREHGAAGLCSGHRGRRANNAIPDATRQWALAVVRERYPDFGPTFAHEKLVEDFGATFSVETLRQWMIAEGLWESRAARRARIHPSRPRRPARGELVQIDGSPHDWLEDRGPRCTLIVFVDDATGELLALHLAPAETTEAYMTTLRGYLAEHGRPVALYSDKHSIFRVNHPEADAAPTQFTRALLTLDIEPIHANTPQAKGRVERANQTLQDRLVKELRLAGIADLATANAFLAAFRARYNARFARPAREPADAHRPVLHGPDELGVILSRHHARKLSKNLTFRIQGREYHVPGQGRGYRLRGATVTVCEDFSGSITVLNNGAVLPHELLNEGWAPPPLEDEKGIHQRIDQAQQRQQSRPATKPAPDHPWRKGFKTPADSPSG